MTVEGEGRADAARGLVARLRAGDARALARAISIVEDGGAGAAEVLAACGVGGSAAGGVIGPRTLRIGVTGAPGVGKSTLVDQMVRWLRQDGGSVGVLAVDPSSPYTGGALLGDRIRMPGFVGDRAVTIRSMASRGAMGGVARAAGAVAAVMEAGGRETILIETVGVGQDEVEVACLVDVTVLVLVPGMGDEVQTMKAGVMEVADVFVVNKADAGGAERVEAEIHGMQGLPEAGEGWVPPVVRTVAATGEGVGRLMAEVRRCAAARGGRRGVAEAGPARAELALDHIGVAVRSIATARAFYERLGIMAGEVEVVAHEQVRTLMLPLGETRVELLEAMGESPIGRFLNRRGEGLHHIAVRVRDVEGLFMEMRAQGVRLASEAVRVGAGGHRYFFVHPTGTGGVLVEIVGSGTGEGHARLRGDRE